jgi:hypothetical protein
MDEKRENLTTVYKSSEDITCTKCKEKLSNEEFRAVVEIVAKNYDEKVKEQARGDRNKYAL